MSASDKNSHIPFLRNDFLKILLAELFGCKRFSRNLLKLKGVHKSFPTAWELNYCKFSTLTDFFVKKAVIFVSLVNFFQLGTYSKIFCKLLFMMDRGSKL